MLAGISGIVHTVETNALLINTGIFHVRVFCPISVLGEKKVGDDLFLHTFLRVKEDELSLYGFLSAEDLMLFEKLISVSGIGPKIALEILSAGTSAVQSAILSEDVAFLSSIKGIGKKTAERAIIELRGKIENIPLTGGKSAPVKKRSTSFEEAIETLEGLGFKKAEIQKKLSEAPEKLTTAEELIPWFLKQK